MIDLEDRFVAECRRQGVQPDQHAMQKAAVSLCGACLTSDGLIHLPNVGSISPGDFVRSMRDQMPEGFGSIDRETPTDIPAGSLTERYRAEIAANRKQSRITEADLARYTGLTRKYMEERYRAAQGK